MTDMIDGCLFCNRTEGVLLRTDNLFVQLDDAPLVEGHVLVMPERHFPSIADMPRELADDFDLVCERLSRIYHDEYGDFMLFEHGRTGHCIRRNPGERICHHAHVHVLPLPAEMVDRVSVGQRTAFTSWAEVAELAGDIEGYLVAGAGGSTDRYFYPVTRPLPSHYLRTVAAEFVGDVELADWEQMLGSERSTRLIDVAKGRLVPHLSWASPSGVRP